MPDSTAPAQPDSHYALSHILHLSQTIGSRGSCTPNERIAAEYTSGVLTGLKVTAVELEPFQAIPSTYWPFALGFAAALVGSIIALFTGQQVALLLAAILNMMGAWAMFAETQFVSHWARWLLPRRRSQNVIGQIPSQGAVKMKVVLCAHLDTHRTPVFYSSPAWHKLFTLLLAMMFMSMVASMVSFGLGAAFAWENARWLGIIAVPIQSFALIMCLHADFTPYSPGANDDASGVGVILDIVRRLSSEPLINTQVYLAFTGCEDVGSYGIQAYLDRHSRELGSQVVYIILDEVGIGNLKYLSADGLLLKHKTHPFVLSIARDIASANPDFGLVERMGTAYTDALSATKRGLMALTVCNEVDPKTGAVSHWHQMSDTPDTLQHESLNRAHRFVWEVLQTLDRSASGHAR